MNQSALILRTALLLLLLMYGTDAEMTIVTSKQDVQVGEQILLLCKAGAEGDITWSKDGDEIDEEKVKPVDETSSKLIIKTATMQDAGRYTCHCEFNSGHTDKTDKQLYVYEGPSFGQTTTYHEFLKDTDGVVPCLVTGQPGVDVQWFRNKQEILTNEGGHMYQLPDNTLVIKNVRREDAGTYQCRAQISGRPISQNLSISVVVNAPPTARLREEQKKVLAGPESNVTLLCLVDGHPQPNINWTVPNSIDPSRHHFNSDRSQLTIRSVTRADYGEYVCTATNKIAESSATIMLHVFEAPEVFVSAEQQSVSVGESVSVSCNVSGHPQPELHWLNKHNGHTVASSGHVRVVDGALVIEEVLPSDGGLYSCMAISTSGNASRDVAIHTEPGPPHYLSVSPEPSSVLFSLKTLPISGGTPITHFALQWRQSAAEQWKEAMVPASDPLAITALRPCTLYTVRLAAVNAVGVGPFSNTTNVHTLGIQGAPGSQGLLVDEKKAKHNSLSIPVNHSDDGGSPRQHFTIRCRQNNEGAEWTEMQLSPSTDSISLKELCSGSGNQPEVKAVSDHVSSPPTTFNFTDEEQPVSSRSMTEGTVIGIVMVIFLVVFLVVDAACCYRNQCGLLMFIAVKFFGYKVQGLKLLDKGERTINAQVRLIRISALRSSTAGVQTKEGGQLTEVTCDKASLTKHEKIQPDRDLDHASV
ncbi:neural cell adhesion molecule 1 isoform X1 [Acanthopagrus latus]|uniref:neural cell adhesion molecule 1 isoform X1 n=1 Tax=Acanthopagrus latus TaxID=8177 RepID=UPI00187C53E1|nr:neural cell adhesion molecule 1 isoform X1 [Acanthopagrus latus]